MSVYTLTRGSRKPTKDRLEQTLEGNLCRCTGYRSIIESFKPFCKEKACGDIEDIHKVMKLASSKIVHFTSGDNIWIRPTNLQDVLRLMKDFPDAKLVMGATAIGDSIRTGHMTGSKSICCSHVQKMNVIRNQDNCLEVGAAIDLAYLENYLEDVISTSKPGGQREVLIDRDFQSEPWTTRLGTSEVIILLRIPTAHLCRTFYYKQSKRKGFDYALVNACFTVTLADDKVTSTRLCFCGIGRTVLIATTTAAVLIGKKPDASSCKEELDTLTEEIKSAQTENVNNYKLKLSLGFFKKFWKQISNEVHKHKDAHDWGTVTGIQAWESASPTQADHDAVGQPIPNVAGYSLVTGEATFIADIPPSKNELYVELVCSKRAHARILSLDVTKAMQVPGYIDFVDSKWIPGTNKWGPYVQDDVLFATQEVHYFGQPMGAVVAESEDAAKMAAKMVDVKYEDLPSILTIQDAIEKESFLPFNTKPIQDGNPMETFGKCDFVRDGVIQSGYQEHMYMEPIAAVVYPRDGDQLEVFVTTQSQKFCQKTLSELLGIPENRITVRTKRLGGGFGGKEYRVMFALGPAAIAANGFRRPVRCVFDRSIDMMISGKRHPVLTEYKIGFSKSGPLEAVTLQMFVDAGYSVDTSISVLNKAMLHVDGSYKLPNLRVEGHVCRTNTPSNTSFRGYGAPEAAFVIESILADVAETLTMSLEQVQFVNLYTEGASTHFDQVLTKCNLERCMNECQIQSKFAQQKEETCLFNKSHKYKKRGIAMMPCKSGVTTSVQSSNQGSALVNIYLDGSVMISHGGIEMGQGLHTKMIQIASRELGVPIHMVHISETATNIIPNSVSTSASFSADIYGLAIQDACRTILERLTPIQQKNPTSSWNELLEKAFAERISLSATGYARIGTHHRDFEKGVGEPYHYYTYGAGCSLVEIDCLTGEHQVLRTDIVMDVGNSLNPGIDIGQIEGAFMQGYGWVTTEEILVDSDGKYNVSGPVDYKIPNVKGVPRDFRISLLKDAPNDRAVYSSKGIGEPPLILSISVYSAIRNAIS